LSSARCFADAGCPAQRTTNDLTPIIKSASGRKSKKNFIFIIDCLTLIYAPRTSCQCVRFRPVRAFALLAAVTVVALSGCGDEQTHEAPMAVRVDAATSLCSVLQQLAPAAERELGITVQLNCASSGTLAQQILHGSDAEVFISASAIWMDHLEKKGLIVSATRRNLWANQLVVVTQGDDGPGSLDDLADARWQPMAMGDPDYVPSGQYARQALRRTGVWDRLAAHAARAPDATAALMHVASGQCPVGIVYATDARRISGVTVAFTIDADRHDPIRYVAAVVNGATRASAGARLLDWLASATTAHAFAGAGFTVVD